LTGYSKIPAIPTPFTGRIAETESYLIDIVLLQLRLCKKVDALRSSLHFFIGNQPKIDIFDTREPGGVNPLFREVNNFCFTARFERPDQYSRDNLLHCILRDKIFGDNKRGFVAHLTRPILCGGRNDKRESEKE
jgi:hypothetical protein